MKNSILSHTNTPLFLQAVNAKLSACLLLENSDFSTSDFQSLIALRHKVVIRELKRLNDAERKVFAQKEMIINQKLEELAQGLLDNAKEEAFKFSRGRAAVKKYK
ncbi:hypothetical protein Q4561_15380 [Alteromonas sp. 1_MG-2023]|uniref:hypothetical protein n=1 Tax=Alteromonas sp. 1_MG-2023 TaxID=3062669 RepID=UPI0026E41161|nr:hypothetical protein [Alteromonas sp. 1_MG-2023]MDO6568452.1 hypothetical protein [Alteromonas sp. 1_MG-2023]